MKILVINGPNLQLLGKREPEIYGNTTLKDIEAGLKKIAAELKVKIVFYQSNHEGEIVDKIGASIDDKIDGILINPAAFTHTSIAIYDALAAVNIPTLEIHISNIHKREEYRKRSVTASACVGVVAGLGVDGYEWGLRALKRYLDK